MPTPPVEIPLYMFSRYATRESTFLIHNTNLTMFTCEIVSDVLARTVAFDLPNFSSNLTCSAAQRTIRRRLLF